MSIWKYDEPSRPSIPMFQCSPLTTSSYRALTPRTRLLLGAGVMAYAAFGLFASDKAEEVFGFTPTDQDRERLRAAVPSVRVVEKDG